MTVHHLIPTKCHQWVKHTITPVEVISGLDDEPIVISSANHSQEAFGCIKCSCKLDIDTAATDCEGESEND